MPRTQRNSLFNSIWWEKLTGPRAAFSVENRLFNTVSGLSSAAFFLLFTLNIAFDIPGAELNFLVFILLLILYGFSRVKKQYKVPTIIFCCCTYVFLVSNYFFNVGITGPTMLAFIATFILIIALGPIGLHRLWVGLHVIIAIGLLSLEYFNVGHYAVYKSKSEHFFDIGITYTVSIAIIYFVILYIRNNYLREKSLAKQYAASLLEQNTQLEELNQVKNRLFSIISHDLRGPLNSIQGYLEVLTESHFGQEEKDLIQGQLLELTKHTQDMLFNLLSWSKSQISGNNIELQEVNLRNTLSGTIEMLTKVAERKGIVLKSTIADNLLVVANADILQLIARNFIQNAIKFTHMHGEITIQANKDGAKVIVSVKDNGTGIPVEKQPEIFSSKLKSAYGTNKERGIGLGLFLCKELVELQGGNIWFTSTPGQGSEFNFTVAIA